MANIKLETGESLVKGTTGDDTITVDRALEFGSEGDLGLDGNPGGGDDTAGTLGESFDGNGGADALVLNQTTLASFLDIDGAATTTDDNGLVSYSDAADGGWTLDDDTTDTQVTDGTLASTAALEVTADKSVRSIAFADGVTLTAGTATSGVISQAGVNSAGDEFALDNVATYNWTGSALSGGSVTASATSQSIVSVDGVDVSAGGTFAVTGGVVLVDQGNSKVEFVPTTTALAAANGNVGDTVTFTLDIVVDIDGTQSTHSVTFSEELDFSAGDDTWNAADNTSADANGSADGGNDTYNGDDRANAITAGAGDDTIYGGNDGDNLNGGAGDDFIRGGNGDDTIAVSGAAATDSNDLGGGAGDDFITGGDGADTIFGGNGDDSVRGGLNGGEGNDIVNGGAGNDLLNGDGGDDILKGGNGDDALNGGLGNDELRGGAGDDTYNGGNGDDALFVSLGDDTLTGGLGNDTFILRDDSGDTVIKDFGGSNGNDKLNVEGLGYTGLADVLAVAYETDAGVILEIDADTTVTLEGVALGDLSLASFDFAS